MDQPTLIHKYPINFISRSSFSLYFNVIIQVHPTRASVQQVVLPKPLTNTLNIPTNFWTFLHFNIFRLH